MKMENYPNHRRPPSGRAPSLGESAEPQRRVQASMFSKVAIVLLAALLAQSLALAQGTVGFTLKGTCDLRDAGTSIYAWSVAVAGGYAYLACAWGGLLALADKENLSWHQ